MVTLGQGDTCPEFGRHLCRAVQSGIKKGAQDRIWSKLMFWSEGLPAVVEPSTQGGAIDFQKENRRWRGGSSKGSH